MTTGTALLPESTANQWDRASYAFLAEKQRRSGSDRTVAGYSGVVSSALRTAGPWSCIGLGANTESTIIVQPMPGIG